MNALITQLEKIVANENEKTVRDYVIEHINEFPAELKNAIIFAFVQEAMALDADIKTAQSNLAESGLAALKVIKKDKNNLVDKQKILHLLGKIKG